MLYRGEIIIKLNIIFQAILIIRYIFNMRFLFEIKKGGLISIVNLIGSIEIINYKCLNYSRMIKDPSWMDN